MGDVLSGSNIQPFLQVEACIFPGLVWLLRDTCKLDSWYPKSAGDGQVWLNRCFLNLHLAGWGLRDCPEGSPHDMGSKSVGLNSSHCFVAEKKRLLRGERGREGDNVELFYGGLGVAQWQ